ncbi:MAG: HEPN domain-containing protein [Chloroflexota bacterium]|nr:HEPN domain-containing protein [Chloroflexota bacterium]
MSPLTTEWITKAEGDLASALRDYRARKAPNYDGACFHAQQCAEKYLKALLQDNGIAFGKTHDLLILYKPLLSIDPLWATMHDDLDKLTAYAVDLPLSRRLRNQAKCPRRHRYLPRRAPARTGKLGADAVTAPARPSSTIS